MINLRHTLTTAHEVLKKNTISHALIGGFALATYGVHRSTSDIDFLADGTKKELIKEVLLKAGFLLKFESNEVLQFTGPGFLDVLLANRPISQEMLTKAGHDSNLDIHILRAEDLIGLKIQAYKNDPSRELQDKADIQNLLKLQHLDIKIIKKYADLFDEWSAIEKIQKTANDT